MLSLSNANNNEKINQELIVCESFQIDLFQTLSKYRQDHLFTDISIFVDGVEFKCHKVILCAASSYFRAMFSCDLRENLLGKVYMENLSPWTMRRLLDYIYSGKIEVNLDNCIDILNASLMFNLNYLIDKCCDYLIQNIDLYNCIDLHNYSELCSTSNINRSLYKSTFDFILDNFAYLIELNDDFVRLNEESFSLLIKSELLNVTREYDVYKALTKWISHDLSARLAKFEELFSNLRLESFDLAQLEAMLTDKMIETESNLVNLIQNQMSKCTLNSNQRPSTLPRDYLCFINKFNFILCDLNKQKWFDLNDYKPNNSLNGYAISVRENKLYLTGGIDEDNQPNDSFQLFDFYTKKWTNLEPMLNKRAFHTSLILNDNYLFVLYGITQDQTQIQSIEYFNFKTQQWLTLTITNSLFTQYMFAATNRLNLHSYLLDKKPCLSLNNIIYTLNNNCLYCYEFNPNNEQLISLPYFHLPDYLQNYSLLGATSIQTKLGDDDAKSTKITHFSWISNDTIKNEALIYFFNTQKKVIYEFYPGKNKLMKLPSLNLDHDLRQSYLFNIESKRLFLTGGLYDDINWAFEEYDSNTNEWSVFNTKFPINRHETTNSTEFPINNLFLNLKMSFK